MGRLWLDRPYTVAGVDLKAARATLHLVTSFGARQDVEIHTDDGGNVDSFDVKLQEPKITSWQDVDAVLAQIRRSLFVSGVEGQRRPVSARCRHQHRRILTAGIDFQALRALRGV